MDYICKNKNCERYGKKDSYYKNTYHMRNGELVSDNAPCPCCGEIRSEINPNECPLSEKNIDLLRYRMASPERKREILKQRSHQHYEKEIAPMKQQKINDAVNSFKSASK